MSRGVPAGELLPCPICGDAPVRNGRGFVGGVLCAGIGAHPHLAHRVQTYGGTQTEADHAWNTRATPTLAAREGIARIIDPDAFATYPFDPDRCEDFIASIEQAAEDALAKADEILALTTPTPPIEGRDADVERVEVLGELRTRLARRRPWSHPSTGVCLPPDLVERTIAALQTLGERG